MLIFRYLLKETFKAQLAIFLILMAIFITLRFVRVLGDATDGEIPANLVLGFLSLYSPILASLLLPISFFLGIMLAHGRLYVDSEMTVLRACGISEWYITRMMLILAVLLGLFTAGITMYVAPLSVAKEVELRALAANKSGLASIIPGRFQQTNNNDAVIFVHDVQTQEDKLSRVFLSENFADDDRTIRLIYADSGSIEILDDGTRLLTLFDGQQTTGEVGDKNYQVLQFDEYRIQIGEPITATSRIKVGGKSNTELLQDSSLEAVAEWQWRIAIPLSLPFLTLIAVPLSSVNPRQGRFGKLLPGILLYLGYFLLLVVARNALEDGKIPREIGLWWVHCIILLIGLTLISRQRTSGVQLRSKIKARVRS